MAAYAALVSLMHIIDQIQLHPRPPISLDKTQVESLTEKVTFLQEFLEGYSHVACYSKEADGLESRIADAAYAAEDVIESHIVDQILAGSLSHGEKISSIDLYQGLEKVIEHMDLIKKEETEITEKMVMQHQLQRNSLISAGSIGFAPTGQNSTMMGSGDFLYEAMDKLIGGQPDRLIIPIVGMGGIGKTTLARNIYENEVVGQHFDILAWVTISQEYQIREILLKVLQEHGENLSRMNENQLGHKLHKKLSGRRYLIIIDDIWDIEVWEKIKFFFPDNNNESRILMTTRLSKLAFQLIGFHGLEMKFLDEHTSWNLLCKNVFGKEDCPGDLEEIGKKIAKNCKGLPLSIVVIGGLLAKSERTLEYWEYISENLTSIMSLEDDERCLKILHMSYKQLPIHLKPCFLYMGVFPEDSTIRVSRLIKLFVAEGFLKPVSGKSLEEVAEENLQELIDRSLILVHKRGTSGKIKLCQIHDLLRELCLREARSQKFLSVLGVQSLEFPHEINTQRRFRIYMMSTKWEKCPPQVLHTLESASLARSLMWELHEFNLPPFSFRLLRVSSTVHRNTYDDRCFLKSISQQVNLRYLSCEALFCPLKGIPSSVSLLWNLQTLVVGYTDRTVIGPVEIWKMPRLRHVKFWSLQLPDPPTNDIIVLENLQTLSRVKDFKCSEEVVKRIPNIKKVEMHCKGFEGCRYYLDNLGHLHRLESLAACFYLPGAVGHFMQDLTFPHSLKKLTLFGTQLHWEEMVTKIGSLPLLQVLKLKWRSFMGLEWETVEGQFCSLKFLLIEECFDLEYWTTDSAHFPCLQHLVFQNLQSFREIPSVVGDIPTLESIQLEGCRHSVLRSAKRILEEQEELGNVGLKVQFPDHSF